MDEKILFYIVVGIIYFLFNRMKKSKPAEERELEGPQDSSPQNGPKPMSFEDLLREITEAKKPSEIPPPTQAKKPEYQEYRPQPTYVDYDDDLEDEEKNLETFNDDQTIKAYEEAKAMAFNRPSLEETLSLKQVQVNYSKFKQFEAKEEDTVLKEYVKDLKDPKGLKKALILNEIMNRRHF